MAQSPPLILKLLASSVRAATRAGKIIRDVMSRGDLGIVEKVRFQVCLCYVSYNFAFLQGKNDLQTEADRSAQRCIIVSLSQQYPNLKIIGEEGSCNSEVSRILGNTQCNDDS